MKINDLTPLTEFIAVHNEWLAVFDFGKSFPLKSTEIEFEYSGHKTLLGFLSDAGFEYWRVKACRLEGDGIVFDLSRNFDRELTTIRLIPRTKSEVLSGIIELARFQRANRIAHLVVSETAGAKLLRVELNRENGRSAQILIRKRDKTIAIISDVSDSLTPEFMLSAAVIRLKRSKLPKNPPPGEIWIVCDKKNSENIRRLHSCLRKNLRGQIQTIELGTGISSGKLKVHKPLPVSSLWRLTPKKLRKPPETGLSKLAAEIVKLAPDNIDCVYSNNGETLRYLGLPIMRTRRTPARESAWFGTSGNWKTLEKESFDEFYEMLKQVKRYRHSDSPNLQHLYFQSSPEAWLESILRKNIKLLDQNLILSPIYNQFRTSRDKIDLLALRRDGRLVIVELKVAADREMIFQAVDYWRKIELQRRKGILDRAALFGERKIADRNTIIYLAAPMLSYHRDFDLLSRAVSNEIEIYRFDLGEKWREKVRVLGRRRIG